MTATDDGWRAGHRLLAARLASAPDLVRAALRAAPPAWPWRTARVRCIVTTGVGASAVHARALATLLADAGVAARFAPVTAFTVPPRPDDALIVFSQGLSPNARLALAQVERWAGVVLVTAVPTDAAENPPADASPETPRADADAAAAQPPAGALDARRRLLDELVARGTVVHRVPAAEEYGTLLRVAGPLVGHAVAVALARDLGALFGCAPAGRVQADSAADAADGADAVRARLASAIAGAASAHPELDAAALAGCVLVAGGLHTEMLGNLPATVQEGLLVAAPPVVDVLGFAHGPLQAIARRATTVVALTRADAPHEDALVARLERTLVAGSHRLVRVRAALPGALAVLEHQAVIAALVVRAIAERAIDQVGFPGRGADRALYDVATFDAPPAGSASGSHAPRATAVATRALAELTWPEVAARRAAGCTTAILPLGSTEQHGPHLPFATDTLIARALAERVAERLGDALCLPPLALGCADEHLGFPGTLSIAPDTLRATVRDLGRALARHGFARLLVFTAHGGNYGVLRTLAADLAPEIAPLRLEAFQDFTRLTAALEAVAGRSGVTPGEAGQHAGEIETSIVLALAPALVRRERLAAGLVDPALPPDELFYPDLRRHAPDGTVGDPRSARAARAGAYLDAWADVLAASWSAPDAKKRK